MKTLLQSAGLLVLCLFQTQCGDDKQTAKSLDRWDLTAAPLLELWQEAQMTTTGHLVREQGGFTMEAGSPMSGTVFPDWEKQGLPLTGYRVTYEAMRVSGADFFGSLTFPVGSIDRCLTFVLGGWGGSQVGISNIDGQDASQNSTGSSQNFESGRWYTVKIEVHPEKLMVSYDGKPLVNVDIEGRDLSLRPGEIERCAPFGFATYGTQGRVRRVVVEKM